MSIRVFLTDDHTIFRGGLKALLTQEEDFEIVGEAGDGVETLEALRRIETDVLLLDLTMPGLSGSALVRTVIEQHPDVAVVILTMHSDEFYLRELFRVGAKGFVLKQSNPADLIRAIRMAYNGERYVDVSLAGMLVSPQSEAVKDESVLGKLTPREKEVCTLLALGFTNAEIGLRLSISVRTVETHRSRIMTKFGFKSRAEIVRFAVDQGLLKGE